MSVHRGDDCYRSGVDACCLKPNDCKWGGPGPCGDYADAIKLKILKMTPEERAVSYLEDVCGIAVVPLEQEIAHHHAITLLIESHKRQRSIIAQDMDSSIRFHRRFRWLPLRLRRWLRGDV